MLSVAGRGLAFRLSVAAAGLAQPADDDVAALPIEIGEREAANAALRGRTDLREIHQRAPQPRAVDA